MNNKIILTGHGNYATGLYSSVELISGPKDYIYLIDFKKEKSDEDLYKEYKQIIEDNKDSNILFICDLLGGSPYKQAAKLSVEYNNIRVVTGANLGGIIDICMRINKLNIDELADRLILSSTKNLQIVKIEKEEEKEPEDGI